MGIKRICDCLYGDDLEYHTMDIYLPGDKGNLPVYIHAHGGGLYEGDKADTFLQNFCSQLAMSDIVAVSMNYSLFDPTEFSNYEERLKRYKIVALEIRRCVEKIYDMALGARRIDKDKIVVGGSSSGAVAALWSMVGDPGTSPERPLPAFDVPVCGAVSMWGGLPGETTTLRYQLPGGYSGWNYFDSSDMHVACIHGNVDPNPLTPFEASIEICKQADDSGFYWELWELDGAGHGPWVGWMDEIVLRTKNFVLNVTEHDPPIPDSAMTYILPT